MAENQSQQPEDGGEDTPAPDYLERAGALVDAEWRYLERWWARKNVRRRRAGQDELDLERGDLFGLALSGGGVRSGSFALGALQQLAEAGLVARAHYLSTVSGGGFAGTSLTWFLSRKIPRRRPDGALEPGSEPYAASGARFPFSTGAQQEIVASAQEAERNKTLIDFIRQRGSYLEPGAGLNKFSAVAVAARAVSLSLMVYFGLATVTLLAGYWLGLFDTIRVWERAPAVPLSLVIGLIVVLAILALNLLYSAASSLRVTGDKTYPLRRGTQIVLGWGWAAAVLLIALGLFGPTLDLLKATGLAEYKEAIGGVSAALGTLGGFYSRVIADQSAKSDRKLSHTLVIWGSAILLIFGLGVLAYGLAGHLADGRIGLAILLAFATLLFAVFANINHTGLHRFYRDRLMETFLPDPVHAINDDWAPQTSADAVELADMCALDHDGPLHLINSNIVLVDSPDSRHRGRGGDSFALSPLYCGSGATGWLATGEWMAPDADEAPLVGRLLARVLKPMRKMTLPTAMAISGAALNPRAGADGRGPTRSGLLSFVLTLLNLRLGYWAPNPKARIRPSRWWNPASWPAFYPPNFVYPGLWKGLLARDHDENGPWVELSDGGHFDNIGLYELVRRRVRRIVIVDGTADPKVDFASFANSVERAFVDFGVRLRFSGGDADFNLMMPGTAEPATPIKTKYNLAERGFAVGEIEYPPTAAGDQPVTGYVLYIKTILTEGLPANLYSYRAAHPSFPDEPTSDQFFDEQQFEAYRLLGHELTRQLLDYLRGFRSLCGEFGLEAADDADDRWPPPPDQPTDPGCPDPQPGREDKSSGPAARDGAALSWPVPEARAGKRRSSRRRAGG